MIQLVNDGGLSDFQLRRIILRATSEVNAMQLDWAEVMIEPSLGTPKIAVIGLGSI